MALQSLSGPESTSPLSIRLAEGDHTGKREACWPCEVREETLPSGSIPLILCGRRLPRKRKEDSLESGPPALSDEPNHGLSDGLAKLGYMPSHGVFALARSSTDVSGDYMEGVLYYG